MKINITVDMTPEEAREIMGVDKVQDFAFDLQKQIVNKMTENVTSAFDPTKMWAGFSKSADK